MDPAQLGADAQDQAHRQARRQAPQGLPHRDGAQQPHVRRAAFLLTKNEDDFTAYDRMKFEAMRFTLSQDCRTPRAARCFKRIPARLRVIGCLRRRAPSRSTRPHLEKSIRAVRRAGRRASATSSSTGIPYISPYNVNSILNPLLVQVMALGYSLQPVPRRAAGEEGRRAHPHPPVLRRVRSTSTTRATSSSSTACCPRRATRYIMREKYEREFADNPSYIEMYRRGNAYHGAHPFLHVVLGRERPRSTSATSSSPAPRTSTSPRDARLGARRHPDRGHRDGARLHGPLRADHDAAPTRDRYLRRELNCRQPR